MILPIPSNRPLRPTRLQLLIAAAGLAVLGLVVWLSTSGGEARGSALSRGPGGWLAARRYLEARGARVRLLDRPLDPRQGGVLVMTFPWQLGAGDELADRLEEHLRRGGDLVVAYSGTFGNPGEVVTLTGLGLPLAEMRKPALSPFRWRGFAREQWSLRPAAEVPGAPPVRVWAPRWEPDLPKEAQVLFRSPRGGPAIAVLRRHHGRIFLLPADAFANARLANAGNAALLETLRRRLGDRWTFDEYHHGLVAGAVVESASLGRTLDLILLHLAALYLVALWTLSRRFGPAWSEPPAVTGSTGFFLLGLGDLHHRLGHHAAAAGRLLERVRELDPGADLPGDLDRRAAAAGPRELVELAREVARRRAGAPASDIERENAA